MTEIWPRGSESGVFVMEAFLPYVSISQIYLLLTEWKLLNRVFRKAGGKLHPGKKCRLMPTPHQLQGHNLTDMIWYQFWVRILNFFVISMTMKPFEIIAWPGVDHTKLFFLNRHFFRFFALKLGCIIVTELFSYVTKWESLTTKLKKRRKTKFGRIDSRSRSKKLQTVT